MCIAVTCHLHFWQNDRDLVRATVVTRGWISPAPPPKKEKKKSAQKVDHGEENSQAVPAGTQTPNLSITHPVLYHWAIPDPRFCITILLIFPPDAIRLAGGLEPHGGRLEVYNNGYWYSVCGLDFNQEEANVVCRNLGFPTWVYRQRNSYPLRWVIFSCSFSSFLRSVLCNTFRCCWRWLLLFLLLLLFVFGWLCYSNLLVKQ